MPTQCTFTKPDGSQCRAYALQGGQLCYCHQNAATKVRKPRRRPKPRRAQLGSALDAKRELARVYNALWRADISPQTANALTQTLNTFARVLEGADFERRLGELQEQVNAIPKSGRPPLAVAGES